MDSRIKWFQAALADKFPDTPMDEFSASLSLEPAVFQKFIETGAGLPSFTVTVLHGLLGDTVDEFVERGRLMSETGQPAAPRPAAEWCGRSTDDLLDKARAILDGGGEPAVTLRTVISLLKP